MRISENLIQDSSIPISKTYRKLHTGSILEDKGNKWKNDPRAWVDNLNPAERNDALREISLLDRPYSIRETENEEFEIIKVPGSSVYLGEQDRSDYVELRKVLLEFNFNDDKNKLKKQIRDLFGKLEGVPIDKREKISRALKGLSKRLEQCSTSMRSKGFIFDKLKKDIERSDSEIDREIQDESLRKQGEERLKREQLRLDFFRQLLERESIANIVGSFMLVVMIAFLIFIVASTGNQRALTIIENIILILTGFFFGQQQARKD